LTNQTHTDIIEAAFYWIHNAGKCAFAFKDMSSTTFEIPDVLGFRDSGGTSILIECKASRGDFLADKKKQFRQVPEMGMGKYRFYCCPTNMIKKEELPPKWGLIYVGKTGYGRAVVNPMKPAYPGKSSFPDRNKESEMRMMFTALRYVERGVDLEKSISIGRYICQFDWAIPNKMPEYPEEVAKRKQTTVKELEDLIELVHKEY